MSWGRVYWEEEAEDRVGVGFFVGYEDPCASFGLFVGGGGGCGGMRENRDSARARAGGEVRGVRVDGVEDGEYGCVYVALW